MTGAVQLEGGKFVRQCDTIVNRSDGTMEKENCERVEKKVFCPAGCTSNISNKTGIQPYSGNYPYEVSILWGDGFS